MDRKSIDFEANELEKLSSGGCVEKTIDGERILVCGIRRQLPMTKAVGLRGNLQRKS